MAKDLLLTLRAFTESQLTRQIVLPLIRAIYPDGQAEETHGTAEQGRDVICTDRHPVLNRSHVLCVQVKNHRISSGATAGAYSVISVLNQVVQARTTGVVLASGNRLQPDEVWVLSTYPFPEGSRRLVQETLAEISKNSGRFIDGNEFAGLLRKYCPDLVRDLEGVADSEIARAIIWLSQHHESKAFGLRLDRTLDDFHVTSRVCPTGALATALVGQTLVFSNWTTSVTREVAPTKANLKNVGASIPLIDVRGRQDLRKAKAISEQFGVPVTHRSSADPSDSDSASLLYRRTVLIDRTYEIHLKDWAIARAGQLRVMLVRLPERLTAKNTPVVRRVLESIRDLEHAMSEVVPFCEEVECVEYLDEKQGQPTRIRVADERLLLTVSKTVFVQGAPGAGKTTFSRRLAVRLLRSNERVIYVACSSVPRALRYAPLRKILKDCRSPGTPSSWSMANAVVIIDGLDECPFDLTDAISSGASGCPHGIIVTARAAFPTRLRSTFPTLEMAGFSPDDRDAFFEKWFKNDPKRLALAQKVVSSSPDIDVHTRLPLIATLVASLVENNLAPATRAEIYEQRLDLLLERWETIKGLRRLTVPKRSQLRFLRQLAYSVHEAAAGRASKFGIEDVRAAFATALGAYGDRLDPDEFVRSFVMVSGVLESDGSSFSFGHLSFQEHLAGWFLAEQASATTVVELLGNDWWAEPLKFYAGIREDITELIDVCEHQGVTPVHRAQLRDLIRFAPHTGSVAVEILQATRPDIGARVAVDEP